MSKLFTSIKTAVIIGFLFLGIITLYVGLGANNSTGRLLFVSIGLVILLPYIIYFLIHLLRERKYKRVQEVENNRLKKYGEKVLIDLQLLKIKSNTWTQEIRKTRRYEDEVKQVEINHNFIELKISHRGKTIYYSINIDMDPITLQMHFAVKKQTYLYVDLKDSNKTYLDLEFLNL